MAFPVTPILDDFNRADEGPPPSASWVNALGTGLAVVSNECAPSLGGDSSNWNTSYVANQEAYVTISVSPSAGNSMSLQVRVVTATDYNSDHYEVDVIATTGATDTFQFWKRFSSVWTQLGADVSLSPPIAAGDQVGLQVIGSELEGFYNGVSVGTRTDSDVTGAGYMGLYLGDTTARLDNFGGGAMKSPPFHRLPNPAIMAR